MALSAVEEMLGLHSLLAWATIKSKGAQRPVWAMGVANRLQASLKGVGSSRSLTTLYMGSLSSSNT